MKILRSLSQTDVLPRGGAVAIGNFDGVHLGHAQIVRKLRALADELDGPAVVFTFDPHPVRLLRPDECPPPLTWTERKAELLQDLQVDVVIAYPTDRALLDLSPQAFFDEIIVRQLGVKGLVEGANFRFGQNRAGDVETLKSLCDTAGIRLTVVPQIEVADGVVSSSRIRQLVSAGDVGQANALLSAPYRIRGMVTHGAGRGGQLGYPTANLEGIDTLLPAHGVYAGSAHLANHAWPAAINVGPNPTFGEHAVKVEVHLIGFEGMLYGEVVEVDVLDRIRGTQRFASADELADQLAKDVAVAAKISKQ